ncbi:MAG: TadE family protein, partial [Gemmataceae bacterium]
MRRDFQMERRERTGCRCARVRRHGVAAVEFALCMPVIALIMLGVWEVGRIVQVSNVLLNSAR